jgi:diacylglycerol kinase
MRRTIRSFSHAVRGLAYVWREERNFRIHTLAAIAILACAGYFRFTLIEAGFVLIAIMLVLGSEILNTVVEDTLDEIHPQHHRVIGKLKDMMAAIVLVNSIGALAIGVMVFSHHFGFLAR